MNRLQQDTSVGTQMRKPSTSTTHKESLVAKSSALKVLSLSSQYKTIDSNNDKQYFAEPQDPMTVKVNPVPDAARDKLLH